MVLLEAVGALSEAGVGELEGAALYIPGAYNLERVLVLDLVEVLLGVGAEGG